MTGNGAHSSQRNNAEAAMKMKNYFWIVTSASMLLAPAAAMPFARAQVTVPQPIPAYHASPPKGPLPTTLPVKDFADPLTRRAYAIAAKIKTVLYQLPCYCRCDVAAGHTSLLSCYHGLHGSECEICKMELFYAYEETRKGKTPAQIRAGIIHRGWEKVDLAKWTPPERAKTITPQ